MKLQQATTMQTEITLPFDVKALKARQIEGHGSVFGNIDKGGDVVVRGAFSESLAEHSQDGTMPQMFWMHDWSQVAGRWDSMAEDDTGLAVKGTLAKTQLGNEMHSLLKMDAVRGLSIGFFIKSNGAEYRDDGVRLIKSVELVEVSLVSLAMNPLAQVEAVKSRLSAAGEYVPTARQFERRLRDVGLSQRVSKRLISAAYGSERDVSGIESEGIAQLLEKLGKATDQAKIDTIRTITRTRE